MMIVDGDYAQLKSANVQEVFYMAPQEGRNDNFDIVGITPAGTAYRCSIPPDQLGSDGYPDGFLTRFTGAIPVEAFTLT
jgi:hypothetical protein